MWEGGFIMRRKCEGCGYKLKGTEKVCPQCAQQIIYRCKKCGKEMDNGKHTYCPLCKTERKDKAIEFGKGFLSGVAAICGGALFTAIGGKRRKG